MRVQGRALVEGSAAGEILFSSEALSFWGGVDPATGEIIDRHHPLSGQLLDGRILAIPSGRGSCSGSVALLEVLLNGTGPAALVFQLPEQIVTLGVIVAKMLFGKHIPVLLLGEGDFARLEGHRYAAIRGGQLVATTDTSGSSLLLSSEEAEPNSASVDDDGLEIGPEEEELLSGKRGKAAQTAARILVEFAKVQNAPRLIPVSQAHIDACVYTGPASVRFAEYFLNQYDGGGGPKVAVPTSMNSISIDQRRWQELGMDPDTAREAARLADAYLAMGAKPTFTCAPYLLSATAPTAGQDVGWAESNAVVFANSVLGARTQKYPDFIDVCIALTGRAPSAGCHLTHLRAPTVSVVVPALRDVDDSLYPLLGYCIGHLCGSEIPYVSGLEHLQPKISDLKAFSAAFATTSSAAMFHIQGVTPEAGDYQDLQGRLKQVHVQPAHLLRCWEELNTAKDSGVRLVALGNPHFALDEFVSLAAMCSSGRRKSPTTSLIVTTGRDVYSEICQVAGLLDTLEEFGAEIITDTCWCMLREPVIAPGTGNIMTNSAKYAHYAPGLVQRNIHFGSLEECVLAACDGQRQTRPPSWLTSLRPN